MNDFDVIVVGTGVAGQTAASELAEAGLRVAVADRREFGGTCALRGCEPKKTPYAAARAVESVRALAATGAAGDVSVDWRSLIEFKRSFTHPKPAEIESWLRNANVTILHGEARFVSPEAMRVGDEEYSAGHFVLATGARPVTLGIPGEALVLDSEAFMELDSLPRRLVFIGGGFISFEFAHIAAAAGAEVTIVHRGARVLREFDTDLARMLADSYRRRGIDVITEAPVTEVRRRDDAVSLEVDHGEGRVLACDAVVHGAGREPDLDDLRLDAAGVRYGRHGVEVDERMVAAGNSRVYAVGDAAALGAPLTPVAIAQARVAVRNIVEPESAVFSSPMTASVCFAGPPIASAGVSEADARTQGLDIEVKLVDSTDWASFRRVGAPVAGAKTIVKRSTGRVLGAHLLGPGADEVINLLALAIERGATADELKAMIWAYPTGGSELVYLF